MTLDPRIFQNLNMEEDYWKLGDEPVDVLTASGSEYHVTSDGKVSRIFDGPSTEERPEVQNLRLNGAVYRGGGPIRPGVIVYGLSMELQKGPMRVAVTSPVVGIVRPQTLL